jgi:VCBS repeat-containing protein
LFLESLDQRLVLSGSPMGLALAETNLVAENLDQQLPLGLIQAEGEGTMVTSRLTIVANRQQVTIPANIGVNADTSKAGVFTTAADGTLQSMSGANATLGSFFDIWRTSAGVAGNNANAVLSATRLLTNVTDTSHTVQMFVNGQLSNEFGNYVLHDGDNIVLDYGSDPVVSLNTNFGPIVIELFETETPGTVDNFLKYVNDGDYINSFFHRSANNSDGTDFVIQGGGFTTTSPTFTSTAQFSSVPTDPPIQNEPGISNVRGTVAMAKTSDPNSATSQFFVNLNNSNTFLDSTSNSGGFTVFGQVLDLRSSDTIAALPTRANPSPYGELPVSTDNQLVVIQSIVGRGEISGTHFNDTNRNSTRDTGETAIAGATVFLDANNNGILDSGEISTLTDVNGRYLFQVAPGSYTVRADLGSTSTLTFPTGADSYSTTVQIGREVISRDFGVAQSEDTLATSNNSLSGFVYLDANKSGSRDTGEVGVPGVQITLTGAGLTRTILTNASGDYSFTELPAGTYQLAERQPAALLDGGDSTTVPNAVVGSDQITSILLDSGQTFAGNNFGEMGIQSQYATIAWFFASSKSPDVMFRETIAVGEELTGNMALATAIRASSTQVPDVSNTAPVANGDAFSVTKNSVLTVALANGVLKNDTDANGDSLTAAVVSQPTHGTLTLNANGSFTYTPTAEFIGPDTFTYRASDGTASSNAATVTITVSETNSTNTATPVAVADSYSVEAGGTLNVNNTLGVLHNDTDADGDTLTALAGTAPTNGTLSLNANGSFTYTPHANFTGTDTFTYTATDGTRTSTAATVTATVVATNTAPVTATDLYTLQEDSSITVSAADGVLKNDSDPQGSAITAVLVAVPQNGTVSLNANGSFNYTPVANFNGTDAFTYSASDGSLTSGATTVTLLVQPVADAPVGVNDIYSVDQGGTLNVTADNGVLKNDTDADANTTLTAAQVAAPTHGTLTLNANGSFVYKPTGTFSGTDAFTYRASDGTLSSNIVTVTVTVNDTNVAPAAAADEYTVDEGQILTIDAAHGLLANDVDLDSDFLTITVTSDPTHGTLDQENDGSFVYTPDENFHGMDTYTYRLNDGTANSNEALVTIVVNNINDLPSAVADDYAVPVNGSLTVNAANGVLANDSDLDGDTLTATITNSTSHGTLSLQPNGSFTYTPSAAFHGLDTFTYKAADSIGTSAETFVTIAVDTLPTTVANSYGVNEDDALTIDDAAGVLSDDSDVDNDALTARILTAPTHGVATMSTDGSFQYQPDANFNGTDTFSYVANDGFKDSIPTVVTITVFPQNDAPVATTDGFTTLINQTLAINAANGVLSNDHDADGDVLTATLESSPTHGTVVLNGDGSFTYTPNNGFSGSDSFNYKASDGSHTSNAATVTITVSLEELVRIRLEATNTDDVPIDTIRVGQNFFVKAYVEDIRQVPKGVFAAYLDVNYDSSIAAVTGPIVYSTEFANGRSGSTTTPGLINEVGAFTQSTLGAGEKFLFRVPFVANSVGTLTLVPDPADSFPAHDTLLLGINTAVPLSLLDLVSDSLSVTAAAGEGEGSEMSDYSTSADAAFASEVDWLLSDSRSSIRARG